MRYSEARPAPYWPETLANPVSAPPLEGDATCDLAIVGGGFSGLWSALHARRRMPEARIILLEGGKLGNAASGRNGGFCAPSISHGVANALARWPSEAETLIRLGRENLDALEADLDTHGIDAEFERPGKLNVAATPWQAQGLRDLHATYVRLGIDATLVEGAELDTYLASPRYQLGLFEPNYALVNPAKLTDGLAQAALRGGVELHEQTMVTGIAHTPDGIMLKTGTGTVTAGRAILATNAAQPLLRRLRPAILPIYDYTLLSAPLSDAQLDAIGWQGRHGIADSGNQFHYFRKTADNRILWGGYDAIYHYGSARDDGLLDRAASYAAIEANFRDAFPALGDIGFSHRWGGIIDTSARLTAFAGVAMGGRVAYAAGFTGQGVSATRFGALTMLDLLDGLPTERTALRMLRSRPVPFPPEPLRSMAVRWAQRDLAREDTTGQRSGFLRMLDRLGIGFGS